MKNETACMDTSFFARTRKKIYDPFCLDCQGMSLDGSLGNAEAIRMLGRPRNHARMRSRPKPPPASCIQVSEGWMRERQV